MGPIKPAPESENKALGELDLTTQQLNLPPAVQPQPKRKGIFQLKHKTLFANFSQNHLSHSLKKKPKVTSFLSSLCLIKGCGAFKLWLNEHYYKWEICIDNTFYEFLL